MVNILDLEEGVGLVLSLLRGSPRGPSGLLEECDGIGPYVCGAPPTEPPFPCGLCTWDQNSNETRITVNHHH